MSTTVSSSSTLVATAVEVPLNSYPESFSISLNGYPYTLTTQWCAPASTWLLSIADSSGNQLLDGQPLVTGVDLLEQFEYLGLAGQLFVQTDGDPYALPTFDNLGTLSHLFFVTYAEPT